MYNWCNNDGPVYCTCTCMLVSLYKYATLINLKALIMTVEGMWNVEALKYM